VILSTQHAFELVVGIGVGIGWYGKDYSGALYFVDPRGSHLDDPFSLSLYFLSSST